MYTMEIVDILSIRSPKLVARSNDGINLATSLESTGSLIYLGDQNRGVHVFHNKLGQKPVRVGPMVTAKTVDISRVGNSYVYVAAGTKGVERFKISGTVLTNRWSYDQTGKTYQIIANSNKAYLANGSGGVWVINVADLGSQTLLGLYDQPGDDVKGIAQRTWGGVNHILAADNTGLLILDVSGI